MPQQLYDDNGNPITEKFDDNGNRITTPSSSISLPNPEDVHPLENIAGPEIPAVSSHGEGDTGFIQSILEKGKGIWEKLNEPIVDLAIGQRGIMPEARALFAEKHPLISKPLEFGVGTMNAMTTPYNLATWGTLGLGSTIGSPGLVRAGKILSYPLIGEGSVNLLHPESSLPERVAGGLEVLGGIAGARTEMPVNPNSMRTLKTDEALAILAGNSPNTATTGQPNIGSLTPAITQGLEALTKQRVIGKVTPKMIENLNKLGTNRVVLTEHTPEIITTLKKAGYKPGGVVTEGEYKGRPYMVRTEGDPIIFGKKPQAETPLYREIWNLPRGAVTTYDMSAPLRQGLPLIGTKAWWTSWDDMVRAWGSEEAYQVTMKSIQDNPLFQKGTTWKWKKGEWHENEIPSIAQKAGLAMTDLGSWTHREEVIQSQLVEKIPLLGGVARRSNRAYTAFLNKLRADTFTDLYNRYRAMPESQGKVSDDMAKEIADFVNDATGRGKLNTQMIVPHFSKDSKLGFKLSIEEKGFESHARFWTDAMFSPRLAASRIRMLNPLTYTQASPFVRKQYLKAALNTAATWTVASSIGALTSGEVSLDPKNADFGKIKFGDLRIDPGAGFQQFLVAYSRMVGGVTTSSTSGNQREYGQGYNADTRFDAAVEFGTNKLHPLLKFLVDIGRASEYRPVQMTDRVMQLYIPLVLQDLADIVKEKDSNLPPEIAAAVASFFGMGSQVYGKGGGAESVFIPRNNDLTFTGGILPGMNMFISHPQSGRSGRGDSRDTSGRNKGR